MKITQIVPAEPGWRTLWVLDDDSPGPEVVSVGEAILAWLIVIDPELHKDRPRALAVWPITSDDIADCYAYLRPDGSVESPSGVMESVAELEASVLASRKAKES